MDEGADHLTALLSDSALIAPDFAGKPAFEIVVPPVVRAPLVFNSPHSGAVYPPFFLDQSRLDPLALRRSEDAFVDELVMGVLESGVPVLRAHFPRAFLDANREPFELDPRMFIERLPPYANIRSLRVAAGLGTIARVVADSQEIYRAKMPVAEALARIETFYQPYHRTLAAMLKATRARFGFSVLVDCHSMPSTAAGLLAPGVKSNVKADIVIGDRFGSSSHVSFVDAVEQHLRGCGYIVQRNKPYAGGFITEHYGAPARHAHAMQIEINRALYMNERTLEKLAHFDQLAKDMAALAPILAEICHAYAAPRSLAAE